MMTKRDNYQNCTVIAIIIICFVYFNEVIAEEIVCGNIDIRNTVKHFNKLEKCTVVEGYVRIVLIDNGTPKDYENLTFPDLREITDYLLLFRAFGLPSLGKLFPNISVIRGRVLFHDFALVVYEMPDLQQLALKSLTDIVRGAVRIEKNPNLCFAETIDWDRIAKTAKNSHFIHGNKARHECPTCGSECPIQSARTSDGKIIGDNNGRLCWNSYICQKGSCPDNCVNNNLTCTPSGQCCEKGCLSGCTINSYSQKCYSCKGFSYKNKCVNKCPKDTYEYLDRRCVSKLECKQISVQYYRNQYLKAIEGKCTPDCPKGYSENTNDRHSCDSCQGPCPKVCSTTQVTNIDSAQSLKGCTEINGSLEIYIQSGGANVIRELEQNLQQLEEIRDFLKVSRSFPLITLNFLKKLRVIHGNVLERNEYSFVVLDNPNLQDLWTYDENNTQNKPLKINKGKIFLHLNPKLCYSKIEKLQKYADIPGHEMPWKALDVSRHSNGDKVACEVEKLKVEIWGVSSEYVGIKFDNFRKVMHDPRSLLGYLIYYRETLYQNVSIFDGRDACFTNVWKVDDFEAVDNTEDKLSHILPHLKPYTQYGLYIKTYTIASETKGAQSDIIYFKTEPDTPSQPRSLNARAQSSSEILIEWEEPNQPNGEVTHYVVTGTRVEQLATDFINQRDFCLEPVTHDGTKKSVPEEEEEEKTDLWKKNTTTEANTGNENKETCCSCKKTSITDDDTEVERRISFEDYLLNLIYIKKSGEINENIENNERRKREIAKNQSQQSLELSTESDSNVTSVMPTPPPPHVFFQHTISQKYISIHNLSHFTEYRIEVRACHDFNPDPKKDNCSLKAMTSARTLPLGGADDIYENSISVTSENMTQTSLVHIKWDEPKVPNGYVVSYHIEYRKVSSDSSFSIPVCITREQYMQKTGYPLRDLFAGNYSLRLRAHSLASWSNWTKPIYFIVPEPDTPSEVPLFIYIVIPVAAVVSVSFVLLTGLLYFKYKKNQAVLDYVSVNPEYLSAGIAYEPDPYWEVPRDKVRLGRELGEGSFGKVYEGIYNKDKEGLKCAVKTVNEHASSRERIDFLKEADVMKSFVDCHHVVKLLGIVSIGHPVFVLMEIMSNGDLRSYLRSHRPDEEENLNAKPPTLSQVLQMAIEISDGMAYLASRKFVHRDLAARNCMVADDLTIKIGDFGMTRDIYETDYYRKGTKGLLPVRWMAPESLKDGVFTTYSDVWSFGVVLWEMVTLASQPYQGLTNEEVLKHVVDGGKMQRPENCPQKLWDLMSQCWSRVPKHRPTFIIVIEMLLNDSNDIFHQMSYYSKYKSQLKQKCSMTSLDGDLSVPLKQNSNAVNIEDLSYSCDDSDVRFFPLSRTIAIPENSEIIKCFDDENYDIDQIDEFTNEDNLLRNVTIDNNYKQLNNELNNDNNTNTNSKTNSVQSSDGSKGSKISSTTSNGSIANGHALHYKTTMC